MLVFTFDSPLQEPNLLLLLLILLPHLLVCLLLLRSVQLAEEVFLHHISRASFFHGAATTIRSLANVALRRCNGAAAPTPRHSLLPPRILISGSSRAPRVEWPLDGENLDTGCARFKTCDNCASATLACRCVTVKIGSDERSGPPLSCSWLHRPAVAR